MDAFFFNEDRHTNNIAVLYDLDKKEYAYCPYFDMGLSLLADVKQDFPMEKSVDTCKKDIIAKPFSRDFDEQLDAANELYVVPNKKIPGLSLIGKNTFTIFVLHGFFIKLADKYNLFSYNETKNLLLATLLTAGILILVGNKYVTGFFEFVLCGFRQKKSK